MDNDSKTALAQKLKRAEYLESLMTNIQKYRGTLAVMMEEGRALTLSIQQIAAPPNAVGGRGAHPAHITLNIGSANATGMAFDDIRETISVLDQTLLAQHAEAQAEYDQL